MSERGELSHVSEEGSVRMVDVGAKPESERLALARARVRMKPATAEALERELERLREAGSRFMVFAWPAFWWLEHYRGLSTRLRGKYRCVLETEHVIIFELDGRAHPTGAAGAR